MRHIPKYKGSYKRTATAPGQILTADTVTSKDDAWHAVLMQDPVGVTKQGHKPRNAFMIKDEYTGLKHMFPLHDKIHQNARTSVQVPIRTQEMHHDTLRQ